MPQEAEIKRRRAAARDWPELPRCFGHAVHADLTTDGGMQKNGRHRMPCNIKKKRLVHRKISP